MGRPRVRRCVECPKCRARYLIARSPYSNGSYLVPASFGSSNEYTLHCCCARQSVVSFWKWSEMKICVVSKRAHDRGYGTTEELVQENGDSKGDSKDDWAFDIARYLRRLGEGKPEVRSQNAE